ncbi:MAG TPA: tetratricopeptide repeat protein [Desulfopila sp.]|nr:tetratricopeptide repeat protein [Desulfopila sp.]
MSNNIQNINDISPMSGSVDEQVVNDPVQAEYQQGKKYLQQGDTAQAAVALHNALIGFEEQNDQNGIANASNQLGNACVQRREYEKALDHYLRAEEICRQLGDPLSLMALSKQFVLVYTELGQYKEAVARCLDLLDRYRANNNPQGTVDVLEKMAGIYIQSGDTDKAADVYRTIASIHKNFRHEKMAESFLQKAEELEKSS